MHETNNEVTKGKDSQDCGDNIETKELETIQTFSVQLLDCVLLVLLPKSLQSRFNVRNCLEFEFSPPLVHFLSLRQGQSPFHDGSHPCSPLLCE